MALLPWPLNDHHRNACHTYLDTHFHRWELSDGEHCCTRNWIDGLHRDFTAADLARFPAA